MKTQHTYRIGFLLGLSTLLFSCQEKLLVTPLSSDQTLARNASVTSPVTKNGSTTVLQPPLNPTTAPSPAVPVTRPTSTTVVVSPFGPKTSPSPTGTATEKEELGATPSTGNPNGAAAAPTGKTTSTGPAAASKS